VPTRGHSHHAKTYQHRRGSGAAVGISARRLYRPQPGELEDCRIVPGGIPKLRVNHRAPPVKPSAAAKRRWWRREEQRHGHRIKLQIIPVQRRFARADAKRLRLPRRALDVGIIQREYGRRAWRGQGEHGKKCIGSPGLSCDGDFRCRRGQVHFAVNRSADRATGPQPPERLQAGVRPPPVERPPDRDRAGAGRRHIERI
jgi:hypothetical protein